jgi:hypothetical protein
MTPKKLIGLLIALAVLSSPASAEWKEKVLYSFQGGPDNGSVPAGGVVFDKQGNLYGVTSTGASINSRRPRRGAALGPKPFSTFSRAIPRATAPLPKAAW